MMFDWWFWPIVGLGVFSFVFGLLVFAFWIWMIVDCAQRRFKNTTEKIIWIIVIFLGRWIGGLAYYLFVKHMNPHGISKK